MMYRPQYLGKGYEVTVIYNENHLWDTLIRRERNSWKNKPPDQKSNRSRRKAENRKWR